MILLALQFIGTFALCFGVGVVIAVAWKRVQR